MSEVSTFLKAKPTFIELALSDLKTLVVINHAFSSAKVGENWTSVEPELEESQDETL
jgi:hypothetical protein